MNDKNEKREKIFNAITDVDEKFIHEADRTKLKSMGKTGTNKYLIRFGAIAACLIIVAGAIWVLPKQSKGSTSPLVNVVFPKAYAFDDAEARYEVVDKNPVDESFLESVKGFSYKTSSKILSEREGNINYSPISMYYALSVAASGSGGDTAKELYGLLGATSPEKQAQQCGNLFRLLYTDNEISKLKIANSLWMDKNISWKEGFVNNAAKNFYASTYSVDFEDTNTGKAMSKWISENTNGNLNPEIEVTSAQILSIINTVCFYDEWTDKFDKKNTAEDKFFLADGTSKDCDFMNNTFPAATFFRGHGYTRSALSLKNSGQMVFILPDEGVSPKELISSPEKMKEAFEGGEVACGEVVWKVPKFSFGSKMDLADTVKSLGVKSAFEREADFSAITDHEAFFSQISQNTHISIDENGVEASAFTDLDYDFSPMPTDKAEMILDRPFVYGIVSSDGTLLFAGICENPTVD